MSPAAPSENPSPRVGIPWRTSLEEAAGITARLRYYFEAVKGSGGAPVPISLNLSKAQLADQLTGLDAFVLPRAPADVNPALYNAPRHAKSHEADANREKTDFAIFEHAFASCKPVLAICYVCQSLNDCLSGSLYQVISCCLHHTL